MTSFDNTTGEVRGGVHAEPKHEGIIALNPARIVFLLSGFLLFSTDAISGYRPHTFLVDEQIRASDIVLIGRVLETKETGLVSPDEKLPLVSATIEVLRGFKNCRQNDRVEVVYETIRPGDTIWGPHQLIWLSSNSPSCLMFLRKPEEKGYPNTCYIGVREPYCVFESIIELQTNSLQYLMMRSIYDRMQARIVEYGTMTNPTQSDKRGIEVDRKMAESAGIITGLVDERNKLSEKGIEKLQAIANRVAKEESEAKGDIGGKSTGVPIRVVSPKSTNALPQETNGKPKP
jgi:hypothetical protein